MAMQDAEPIDSPLGMAIASNALLAEIIQFLVDKHVINRFQLMTAITRARRRVNIPDRSEHHDAADRLLDALQKRFPVE